jgi:hypothetical protein
MASILIVGVISNIQYLPNHGGCVMLLSEFRRGYKRKDGVRVEDKIDQWKVIFRPSMTKFVSDHFSNGMAVEVKGDARPFAIEHDKAVEGYSVLGQTVTLFSYPKPAESLERRAIQESQRTSCGMPDLSSLKEDDF